MATGTLTNDTDLAREGQDAGPKWQTALVWIVIVGLLMVAIGMRLYQLGAPIERDYDEGVYWQSMRAMGAGYSLYQQVFYSQPPFFLLELYPLFTLFGGTLGAARFGIVLLSLPGFVGALLLGRALHGRLGALVAVLLLVVSPIFLVESRVVQADAPSAALSLLAVGLIFTWWEHPDGRAGLCWAVLSGVVLTLSILCKLLVVATVIPAGLLILMRLVQIWKRQPGTGRRSLVPIVAGIIACIVTALLLLLPFLGTYHTFIQMVVTFHTAASSTFAYTRGMNFQVIGRELFTPLGLAALYGTLIAVIRLDMRVLPLVAWLFGTVLLLTQQLPLFPHHLVALAPPLIALATLGIGEVPAFERLGQYRRRLPRATKILAAVLLLLVVGLAIQKDYQYYVGVPWYAASGVVQRDLRIAGDLRNAITPAEQVVTDEQFMAGLADRTTPPDLVDTSNVRITTGYLTLQQLEAISLQPQVHAVLFFSGRFRGLPPTKGYHTWVTQHFHLLHDYGNGQELWVR